MALKEVLIQEFEASFKMIRTAISRMKGEFWKEDENHWSYGFALFHVIETVDFYLSDSQEQWKPLTDISRIPEEKQTEELGKKEMSFFLNYQVSAEKKFKEVFERLSEEQLLEKDGYASFGFQCRAHKFSYILRHSMVHLGEMSKSLRQRSMDRIKWE